MSNKAIERPHFEDYPNAFQHRNALEKWANQAESQISELEGVESKLYDGIEIKDAQIKKLNESLNDASKEALRLLKKYEPNEYKKRMGEVDKLFEINN